MQLVTLYRDGLEATVDKDITETYENFLAHGWADKPVKAKAPVKEVEEKASEEPRPTRKAPKSA